MPIKPELRGFYSINWRELPHSIRFRQAKGACERCGRPHGKIVCVLTDCRWFDEERSQWRDEERETLLPDSTSGATCGEVTGNGAGISAMGKVICLMLACTLLGGCAIHPAPGDYDRSYTLGIVQSIRCEARDGIKDALLGIMSDEDEQEYIRDPGTREARRRLSNGQDLAQLDLTLLHPKLRALLDRIKGIVVIYDFRFELTELNTNTVSAGFEDVVRNGLFDLGLNAAANLTRQNTRSFRTVDVVDEYFQRGELDRTCKRDVAQGRFRSKILYPLSGRIGLKETLQTYLLLIETAGLSKSAAAPEAAVPRTLIEKLTFTTELSVGVDPKITIEPITDRFAFASATGIFKSTRKDVHEVTIALSLEPNIGELNATEAVSELNRRQLLDSLQARRGF